MPQSYLVLVHLTQRLLLLLRNDSQDASNRLAHNLAATGRQRQSAPRCTHAAKRSYTDGPLESSIGFVHRSQVVAMTGLLFVPLNAGLHLRKLVWGSTSDLGNSQSSQLLFEIFQLQSICMLSDEQSWHSLWLE
ncbi:hypothetical protein ABBQ38_007550 [Trebouxia sp. C0009 RCD-2024]